MTNEEKRAIEILLNELREDWNESKNRWISADIVRSCQCYTCFDTKKCYEVYIGEWGHNVCYKCVKKVLSNRTTNRFCFFMKLK